MSEVINQQRKIKIDLSPFQDFTEKAVEAVSEARGKSVAVAFVSDRKMRELNRMFRHKNSTTDVLSFPFEADEFEIGEANGEENLGDIVISIEQAVRQAAENDFTLETEIKQLILHGVLHLGGYDHETDRGEMNTIELKLRDKLGING